MSKKLAFLYALPLCLTACGPKPITVNAPSPPASYMVCEELPARPDLKPLEAIALPDGRMAYLKAETDARDAKIARYVVESRAIWFECFNNAAKLRDYYRSAE
jgi:hypothetical protein